MSRGNQFSAKTLICSIYMDLLRLGNSVETVFSVKTSGCIYFVARIVNRSSINISGSTVKMVGSSYRTLTLTNVNVC